ncbi:hypothetical protein F5Y19DRAFT_472638 [Xylariaceae sp. FL1651]|nr:hypothetical protein F5Y19DRAFT_472638 [Xylariaceae sp. FL1651]
MPQRPPLLDPARTGEDKGSATIAAITIVSSISTLFVVAGLWISGWISAGFTTAAVHSGSGRHI